jgi:hypothetical protein
MGFLNHYNMLKDYTLSNATGAQMFIDSGQQQPHHKGLFVVVTDLFQLDYSWLRKQLSNWDGLLCVQHHSLRSDTQTPEACQQGSLDITLDLVAIPETLDHLLNFNA